jgi:hypothetical protein
MVVGELRTAAARAAYERTLYSDETIGGLRLPSGSTLRFRDKSHLNIVSVDLPGPAMVLSMPLSGVLVWSEASQVWSSTLAENYSLRGWPCHAGVIEFDAKGVIQSCDIAAGLSLLGLELPPGTHVTRGGEGKPWAFGLPSDAGLAMSELSTWAPAGVTLSVDDDGHIARITSGHGQTIFVQGVPLNSMNFYRRGDKVLAALAQPFMVAGEMRPVDTGVTVDINTGATSLASKHWWLSEEPAGLR